MLHSINRLVGGGTARRPGSIVRPRCGERVGSTQVAACVVHLLSPARPSPISSTPFRPGGQRVLYGQRHGFRQTIVPMLSSYGSLGMLAKYDNLQLLLETIDSSPCIMMVVK